MWQFGRGQGEGTGGGSSQPAPMTTDLTHRASRRQAGEPHYQSTGESPDTALALNAWAEAFSHREHSIAETAQLEVSRDSERQNT